MPVDAILKSRVLANVLVLSGTATTYVDRMQGRLGVILAAESLSVIGGTVYGTIRLGRWYRNVKPPEPKARRAKSDDPS